MAEGATVAILAAVVVAIVGLACLIGYTDLRIWLKRKRGAHRYRSRSQRP